MANILKQKPKSLQTKVKEAPLLPGVYIYRDPKGKILYIGKAKVLRNRVKSYFSNYSRVEEKIRQMIDLAESVEYYVVDSEVEALILESMLIKKYKPKYNSQQVDDKNYIYVKFDKPKRKGAKSNENREDFPRIQIVREKLKDDAEYFGPYPDTMPARRLLRNLRKVFPYRTCDRRIEQVSTNPLKIETNNPKPCLYYHLGVCGAPCATLQSKADYMKNFNNIKKFFKGEKNLIAAKLEARMKKAASQQKFEEAAQLRNRIRDIRYVASNIKLDVDIDEVVIMKQKQERRKQALQDLITRLQFPVEVMSLHPKKQFRIEAYDISNIQGSNAVGSMVVFIDGEPKPQLYRRFKIKMKNEPNDFAMLQEVLTRRFNQYLRSKLWDDSDKEQLEHNEYTDNEGFTIEIPKELKQKLKNWKPDESFSQTPDLIIIDGGKGQLSSTYKILQSYGLVDQVPIVGLAKQEEELFKVAEQFKDPSYIDLDQIPEDSKITRTPIGKIDDFVKIRLPRRSESLYLVQRIRDEAHRFAITYHRKLRSKKLKELIK